MAASIGEHERYLAGRNPAVPMARICSAGYDLRLSWDRIRTAGAVAVEERVENSVERDRAASLGDPASWAGGTA